VAREGWPTGLRAAGGRILTQTSPVAGRASPRANVTSVSRWTPASGCRATCSSLRFRFRLSRGLLHPDDAESSARRARCGLRDLILVFLVLKHDRLMDDHWIFFPERRYPFNRLFEQKAMSETLGPRGQTAVCCDLTCDEGDATWRRRTTARAPLPRVAGGGGLTTPDTLETRLRAPLPQLLPDVHDRTTASA
jgi:hypothetical protein